MFEDYVADPKSIQRVLTEPVARQFIQVFRRHQECSRFQKGDFVVERRTSWNKTVSYTENIANSGIPARFMVCHRDEETGLTFAARINNNGKLGKPFCLETKNGCDYELDPAYEDHILLGGSYNPVEDLAQTRKYAATVKKYNQSIVFLPRSQAELEKFIEEKMLPGTMFWHGWSESRDVAEQAAEVVSISSRPMNMNDWHEREALSKGVKTTLVVTYVDLSTNKTIHQPAADLTFETIGYWHCHEFYLQKPMSYRLNEK